MVSSAITRVGLRPSRSPKWPKSKPPIGRATKPTAAVLNAASTPGDLAATREEQRTEDQSRRRQVDEEVVPFDRRPRHRRQSYFPHRGWARCRSLRARFGHDYPPFPLFCTQKISTYE